MFAPDSVYTIKETANLLKCCEKTVKRYIENGKLEAFKIGNQTRIKGSSLNSYIESHSIPTKAHQKDKKTK